MSGSQSPRFLRIKDGPARAPTTLTRRASSLARRVMRDWLGASCSSGRSPARTCYPASNVGWGSWPIGIWPPRHWRAKFLRGNLGRQEFASGTPDRKARGSRSLPAETRLTVYRRRQSVPPGAWEGIAECCKALSSISSMPGGPSG